MKVQNIRKTSTKASIMESFTQLLKKKELEKITIKNITDSANINRATFYAHFDDKYQLFDELFGESAFRLVKKHTKRIEQQHSVMVDPLLDAVFEYIQPIKENYPYNYQNLLPRLREKMVNALMRYFESSCHLTAEKEVNYFTIMLFARMLYDAAELSILEKTSLSKQQIIDQMTTMFNQI
ncbi:TetR/AcrR family transcriptional regulator [Bacillus cereus group sp. MYBK30-1]|uniref:TetR/AcrR family transcriptional regulator n=1 Tax=unclassified Bacillus cereus group TaxID=2750818 RepID=UPI003F78CB26